MTNLLSELDTWLQEREYFISSVSATTLLEFCLDHKDRTAPGAKASLIKLLAKTFRLPWDCTFENPSSGVFDALIGEATRHIGVTDPEAVRRLPAAAKDLETRGDERAASTYFVLYSAVANQRFNHSARRVPGT